VAVAVCGDAVAYAGALAELEAWRVDRHGRAAEALALAATGGSLLERVRRVLSLGREDARTPSMAVPMLALMALGLVGSAAFLRVPALQATGAPVLSETDGPTRRAVVMERHLVLDGDHVVRLRERELQAGREVLGLIDIRRGETAPHVTASLPTVSAPDQQVVIGQAAGQRDRLLASMVSGAVRDPRGAAVEGARVVLSNLESAATHVGETDNSGRFQFADVVAGDYLLDVSTPWAEPARERIGVAPRQTLERSVRLEVRGVTMMTKLVGPRSARPTQARALPNGWSCADNRPGFCGPPSLVQELERDQRLVSDRPTRVASMTRMPDVQYPQPAWDARIEGTAVVEGRVGSDGVPIGLHVTAPVYAELAAAAIDGVSAARFEPARLGGVNVDVPLSVTVEFRLH
jgi:TonB family protein